VHQTLGEFDLIYNAHTSAVLLLGRGYKAAGSRTNSLDTSGISAPLCHSRKEPKSNYASIGATVNTICLQLGKSSGTGAVCLRSHTVNQSGGTKQGALGNDLPGLDEEGVNNLGHICDGVDGGVVDFVHRLVVEH